MWKTIGCLFVLWGASAGVSAQDAEREDELGWSNTADLSLVMTGGNSAARTIGFTNTVRRAWPTARLEMEVNGVRSGTADDRFFLVDPGVEFPVGETLDPVTSRLVKPQPTPDAANYLISGRFDKDFTEQLFWNTGASWDRNEDAGILHRYIAFVGLGNTWRQSETRQLSSSYGISYTDREEERPDPTKDRRFGGARLGLDYLERFGDGTTTLESDFISNMNLADTSDFSFNTTHGVSVAMNDYVSLKVSLQLLFENNPALEIGLDVIARVELVDPDGTPGTGDELFRTMRDGGTQIVLGKGDALKDQLDTVFRTSVVLTF